MAKFKIDDQVKVKFSPMTGVVKGAALDQVSLEIQYLVDYADNDGVEQSRYFDETQIELV